MILEITGVKHATEYKGDPIDAYLVTGKVGDRERSVYIAGEDVSRRLEALGCTGNRTKYDPRDLAPLIAQLATHDLSEAFSRKQ